jgi:hypothetical protein
MTSKTFSTGTVIDSAWLNDVNTSVYVTVPGISTVPNVSNATGTLAVSHGGTGATTASAARTALGSTTVGDAVFVAASQAAAQTAIGYVAPPSPSSTTPLVDTTAGTIGIGTTYARNDHTHPALPSTLAASGYQKFPSGLIIQWGTGTFGSSVTFPTAFPTSASSVVVTPSSSTTSAPQAYISALSTSAFTSTFAGTATTFYWQALGY